MTIENVAISMLGSDADNIEKTLYTSTTPWEPGGINLIVHVDGLLKQNNLDYIIVDNNTIQFNNPLNDNQNIQFVITRLVNHDNDKVSIDRVAKKLKVKLSPL